MKAAVRLRLQRRQRASQKAHPEQQLVAGMLQHLFPQLLHLKQILFFLKFVEDYAVSIDDTIRPYSVDTWEKAYELWSNTNKYFI